MSTAPQTALDYDKDMSWVSDRYDAEQLVAREAPTLWLMVRKAIETNVSDFGRLYPSAEITARFSDSGHDALVVSVLPKRGFGTGSNVHLQFLEHKAEIETDNDQGRKTRFRVVAEDNKAVIKLQDSTLSPKEVAKVLLEPLLFPKAA